MMAIMDFEMNQYLGASWDDRNLSSQQDIPPVAGFAADSAPGGSSDSSTAPDRSFLSSRRRFVMADL